MNKITVQIFGIENINIDSSCGVSSGCGGCKNSDHKCGDCGNGSCGLKGGIQNVKKTMGDVFKELVKLIKDSDVRDKVYLEFIDVNKIGDIHPYNDILELLDNGFELPITVIDGIVRYYGGISGKFIYNDIKELLS